MKTALITGIDKGIGKALMEKFLSEGYFVIGTYLSSEPERVFSAESFGVPKKENLQTFQLDLSSSESIKNCVAEIKNTDKKIDILINNAGVMLDKGELILNPDKLRKTLEVNLIGTSNFTEQMISFVNSDGPAHHDDVSGGHIICISSIAGSFKHVDSGVGRSPNHYPAYRISKAALNMYVNNLAERIKDQNIIVSAVHPGPKRIWVDKKRILLPKKQLKIYLILQFPNQKQGTFGLMEK